MAKTGLRAFLQVVRSHWPLLTILVIGLLLDLGFFTGYFASDDVAYTLTAHLIASGQPILADDLAGIRLALTLPLALVFWLSAGSTAWLSLFQILYHLGCVVVAFALGRRLHNQRTGLFAAFLTATSPLFFIYAGAMLPDAATAMFAGLSMLTLDAARRRPERFFWAGILNGLAYSCKETGLVLVVAAAIAIIAASPPSQINVWVRRGFRFTLGLVAFLLLEALLLRALSGEWFVRLTVMSNYNDVLEMRMAAQGTTPWARFAFVFHALHSKIPLTLILLLGGSLAYLACYRRSILIVAYFWWPLLFLTIGTTSLSAYRPASIQSRYYSLLIIPATCALGYVIHLIWERWAWRYLRPATLFVLGLCTVYELTVNAPEAGNIYGAPLVRSFRVAFERAERDYPDYPIVLADSLRRMWPLLLPDDVKRASGASYRQRQSTPQPPFVYLDRADNWNNVGPLVDTGLDLTRLKVQTVAVVRPTPAGPAWIWRQLRGLFAVEPVPPGGVFDMQNATVLQLVTIRPLGEVFIDRSWAPLIAKPASAVRIEQFADRAVVRWKAPTRFSIDYFERKREIRASWLPHTRIIPATTSTTVRLRRRIVAGGPVYGRVGLYLYDETGRFLGEAWQPFVDDTRVTLDTSVPAHRFRLVFEAETTGAGTLQLFPLTVNEPIER